MPVIRKIISGGQTGVDCAALRLAIRQGIAHGGWCPKGRRREDGLIPKPFKLAETPSRGYLQRTEWNVRDSDGTVIFSILLRLQGGSRETVQAARRYRKPWVHLAAQQTGIDHAAVLRQFVREHRLRVLNVAGPRASQEPAAGRFAARTLRKVLARRGRGVVERRLSRDGVA